MLVSLFRRAVVSEEVHQQFPFSWKHSPRQKSHFCFFCLFFGSLNLCHGLKRWTSLLRALSFCQVWGQTGMCLLKTGTITCTFWEWNRRKVTNMPIPSHHSSPLSPPLLADEVWALRCHRQVLFGCLSASPVSRLSSPKTFFWPLRTLVPFGALVNAILHPLTWLVRTSFSGFNSDTPPSGDLTWFPGPEVETAPGLPRAFCKDTLPLHLVARWRVLLDLLLPFPLLPSFPFAPSSPSPSPPSLECPLFVQYPDSTGKERSPLAPHTGCLSLASLDPIPAALLGTWEAGQGTCIHGLPAFRSPFALTLQGHQVRSEGGREGTWGSSPPPPLLLRPSNKGCGPPQCPSLLSHLAGFWFCLSFFCLQAFLGLLTVPPSLFQGYSSELRYFP